MTLTPLAARTLETIRRHALLRDGHRVLVGLSGGADSVALLLLLRELEAEGVLQVTAAAHLHHGLRGPDADGDEAFCAALAARLAIPFVLERADVAALAREHKRSIEDAARRARYAFFERAAADRGADLVAVGHTRDDQAETFLLRLLRGAGTRGLGGIRPCMRLPAAAPKARRWVIRPLIELERAALRHYLTDRGQPWREDASNDDVQIARNRVRHVLIPSLESQFSPAVVATLAREAALARQDEDFLHDQAIELAGRIVLTDERSHIRLDAAALAAAPRALSSRVVLHTLERHAGGRFISFEHVDRVLALGPGEAVSLPGQDVVRTGNDIAVRPRAPGSGRNAKRAGGRPSDIGDHATGIAHRVSGFGDRVSDIGTRNGFAISLSIPGEVELSAARLALTAERLDGVPQRPIRWAARGMEVGVAAGLLELPLAVRSRRPGDRFRPLGAPGARKLQDFLVDRKVAREARDTVPLVVDGRDRIVWVVGQSVAEDFRVTDASRGVILLKVRHLGGAG